MALFYSSSMPLSNSVNIRRSDRDLRASSEGFRLQRRPVQDRSPPKRNATPVEIDQKQWRSWTTSSALPSKPPTTCINVPQLRRLRSVVAWKKRSRLYQRAVADRRESRRCVCSDWLSKTTALGNDEEALRLYERAAKAFPTGLGALVEPRRLMYEDRNEYDKAQIVLQANLGTPIPMTSRTTALYMKDASATGNMLYDEEAQRRNDRLAQILNMPVTNFELSVRSRNCLAEDGYRNDWRPDTHQRSLNCSVARNLAKPA